MRTLTSTQQRPQVDPSSDEWVPPGWGTDEENAKEAAAFAAWTQGMKPKT